MPNVVLKYFNASLGIGMLNWRNAWLLGSNKVYPVKLLTEHHCGRLVFRVPGTGKRFSYLQVKKTLRKTSIIITIPDEKLPF